ncbi:MAG: AMP-binding protein, partial [Eggerthellaceae bacterium]|nr:AMP-binding protein [Eggerthellaceae bacterium]
MIDTFESTARTFPNKVFLTYVDASGKEASLTYRQARLIAAAMAIRLRGKGVHRGDYVSVDLPNCAEYVLLALAAAYGSFTLVCLNHRLTSSEKISRLFDLEREGVRIACRVDL